MTLPKINAPIFSTILPSTNKAVEFRPFLVKEEKSILLALRDGTSETIFQTIKDIIESCTFGKIDVNKLTVFDVEHMFIQLRIKSKGANVNLTYTCLGQVDGKTCNHQNTVTFDLNNVSVQTGEGHTKRIMITDTIGMNMRYPYFNEMSTYVSAKNSNDMATVYKIAKLCISEIFEGDIIYDSFTSEELQEWIEDLDPENYQKIENFFNTMPTVKSKVDICCSKCGNKAIIPLEGLESFLG